MYMYLSVNANKLNSLFWIRTVNEDQSKVFQNTGMANCTLSNFEKNVLFLKSGSHMPPTYL